MKVKEIVGVMIIGIISLLIMTIPPLVGAIVLDKVMTDSAEIESTTQKLKNMANELAKREKEDK